MAKKSTVEFITEIGKLGKVQENRIMQIALEVWRELSSEDKEVIAKRVKTFTEIRNCGSGTALEIYTMICYKMYPHIKGMGIYILEQQFAELIHSKEAEHEPV